MKEQKDILQPETIDHVIEAGALSQDHQTNRLIQQLHASAHEYAQENERSLDRIWSRLVQSQEHPSVFLQEQRQHPEENVIAIKERKAMKENNVSWGMSPSTPPSQAKKRPSLLRVAGISLIAAVAVITILSFTIFSGVLRPAPQTTNSNKSTLTGSQNHQQQQTQQQQRVITNGKQACNFSAGSKVAINGAPWSADLSWSSQGQIAVTTYSGVKVYSAKDCKATAFSQPQIQQAYRPVWSPDGSKLLVSSGGDMGDYVLDSNGKIITKLKDHFVGDGIWSSDSNKILFTQGDGDEQAPTTAKNIKTKTIKVSIKAVDISNGSKVTTVSQLPDNYSVVSFSANGKLALLQHLNLAKKSKDIAIWDISAGKLVTGNATIPELPEATYDEQLSPDGSLIALDQDGKIDIYTTANGKLLASFENKVTGEGVHTLAWSPDGKYLAESADTIKIFDMTAKKLATTFGKVSGPQWITTLIWSPDGSAIASSTMTKSDDQPSDMPVNIWQLS
jgi:WD40 repeat protein